MVFQRNTKRQTFNKRRGQFPFFQWSQGTLQGQNKFFCLSRSGIVHKIVKECHSKPKWNIFRKLHKGSYRLAYKKLVSAKQSSSRKSQEKWSADCIDWEMAAWNSRDQTRMLLASFWKNILKSSTDCSLTIVRFSHSILTPFAQDPQNTP